MWEDLALTPGSPITEKYSSSFLGAELCSVSLGIFLEEPNPGPELSSWLKGTNPSCDHCQIRCGEGTECRKGRGAPMGKLYSEGERMWMVMWKAFLASMFKCVKCGVAGGAQRLTVSGHLALTHKESFMRWGRGTKRP